MRTLHLGPGFEPAIGAVHVDGHPAEGVHVAADPRKLPFPDGLFLEIRVASVVERCADPYLVLDEIHRALRHSGRVEIRVASPWAMWGPLDRDGFVADVRLWREILAGYFDRVDVQSEGTRYRDNAVLRGLSRILIRLFGWHELAEVWRFQCSEKLTLPQRKQQPWW